MTALVKAVTEDPVALILRRSGCPVERYAENTKDDAYDAKQLNGGEVIAHDKDSGQNRDGGGKIGKNQGSSGADVTQCEIDQ